MNTFVEDFSLTRLFAEFDDMQKINIEQEYIPLVDNFIDVENIISSSDVDEEIASFLADPSFPHANNKYGLDNFPSSERQFQNAMTRLSETGCSHWDRISPPEDYDKFAPFSSRPRDVIDLNKTPLKLKNSEQLSFYSNFVPMPDPWTIPQADFEDRSPYAVSPLTRKIAEKDKHQIRLPYNGKSIQKYLTSDSIRGQDVLFGRGKKSNNHVGNKFFRELVLNMAKHYKDCSRVQKTAIASSIVDAIHENGGGRFLSPVSSPDGNLWVEMTGLALRKKTSQALRDCYQYRK